MRYALPILALALLSSTPALAQVAASPRDEAYCDQYYRFGASGRLNCVLNSRIGRTGVPYDDFGPGVRHPRYRSW